MIFQPKISKIKPKNAFFSPKTCFFGKKYVSSLSIFKLKTAYKWKHY